MRRQHERERDEDGAQYGDRRDVFFFFGFPCASVPCSRGFSQCLPVGWLPPLGRVDLDIGYTPYVVGYARFDLTAPQAILCGFDNGRAGYYEY